MSEARDDLRDLVNSLAEDQVSALLAEARRRSRPVTDAEHPWPPSWFGAIDRDDLPSDLARNHDDYLTRSGFDTIR